MLYQAYAMQMGAFNPFHYGFKMAKSMWNLHCPFSDTILGRSVTASLEVGERMTRFYDKPPFGLDETVVDHEIVSVVPEIICTKPYCNLLHFKRDMDRDTDPKLLFIAPLSGHYATLFRGTVEHFLTDHEVYVTDWLNPRDIPVTEGKFHLDDYVAYLVDFITLLGEKTHVIAICQPGVPMLTAAGWMAMNNHPAQPTTLTIMGAPIDPRINPTEVDTFAVSHSIEWMQKNLIYTVPPLFQGHGQRVYPGFFQLAAFASMNWESHMSKHKQFIHDILLGNEEGTTIYKDFYDEYSSVVDLPEDYYLETVKRVFQDFDLPKGKMTYRGEQIDLKAIEKTALMTVEGELDDITGIGQTKAAHSLCKNIKPENKFHYLQKGVGHYGISSGGRFRKYVGPAIAEFLRKYE